jgi:hypothetical protein
MELNYHKGDMMYQLHSETSKGAYLSLSHEQTQLEYIYALISASENKGLTGRGFKHHVICQSVRYRLGLEHYAVTIKSCDQI